MNGKDRVLLWEGKNACEQLGVVHLIHNYDYGDQENQCGIGQCAFVKMLKHS
jgi:hypothetical protein